MRQAVGCGAQSLAIKQPMHAPLPSHTLPLLSLHTISGGALISMHMNTDGLHTLAWQAVVVAGQSAGMEQPTMHEPLPSQTLPLLSLQGVPPGTLVVPQAPPIQVLLLHRVAGAGQLLGTHCAPRSGPAMSLAAPGQVTASSMHDPLHGDWPARHETSAGVEQPAISIATMTDSKNRTRTILTSAASYVSVIK
jgi:hypothetical protein